MARKLKTSAERLAHKFAVLNRKTRRNCLREAIKHQARVKAWGPKARSRAADCGVWQDIVRNEAKWAMHYLTKALTIVTDERALLPEATARLASLD